MTTTPQIETEYIAKARSPRPRVLVVALDEYIRDLFVLWLLRDGFDCREAAYGQDALDLLATGLRIDLVLSDYGWVSLLPQVKEHHPRIPFALFGCSDVRDVNGTDGYLVLPCKHDDFLELVRSVLGSPPRPCAA